MAEMAEGALLIAGSCRSSSLSTMKTHILSLMMIAALGSGAFAGTTGGKVVAPPVEPQCFEPGLSIGAFGTGFLPHHNHDGYKNSLGGGVLGEYFFNDYLGLQLSYSANATNSTQHVFNGDIILRAPIESICVAPYLMVGGGFHVDGSTRGEYHAGGGIEARIRSVENLGVFVDGAYHWHSSGESDQDFTLVRLGLKFHL